MPLDSIGDDLILTHEVTTRVGGVMREEFGQTRHGRKQAAKTVGSSLRAVDNWMADLNSMSLVQFIRAARTIPRMKALAVELLQIETAVNPEFEANLKGLMATAVEKGWIAQLSERASGNAD